MRLRPLFLTAVAAFPLVLLSRPVLAQDDEWGEGEVFGEAEAFGDPNAFGNEPAEEVRPEAPPPVNRGVIQGLITDPKGEPAIEAQITIVGTPYETYTDVSGRYRFELPPGTYNVRIFYQLHKPAEVQGVKVGVGQVVEVDGAVEPEEGAVQEIEVIGVLEKTRLEGQLLSRQRSASVGDIIGRSEISKTPDSNAAEAARRVVGASIVGGRFVYVRGLGERYSNALFDGAPLPSPEPDRAAIPLDLFPVAVLDSITIVKTFTPDLPADFAGGSVQIDTRSIPDGPVFSVGTKLGYVTGSTFQSAPMYKRSRTDWLGFDSGLRALPSGTPDDYLLQRGTTRPDGSEVTSEEITDWGRRFNSSMNWHDVGLPPNHSFDLVVGNGWKLPGEQKLGAIASLTYGRSFLTINDYTKREFRYDANSTLSEAISPQIDYKTIETTDSVRWGAYGSISYAPGRNHELGLVLLHSQLADATFQRFSGRSEELARRVAGVHEGYESRGLNVVRLTGTHEFEDANDATIRWAGLYSAAFRNELDTRDAVWGLREDGEWSFITNAGSGRHFWADMSENGLAGNVDYTQPLGRQQLAKLKLGAAANVKDRGFRGRRFEFGSRTSNGLGCGTTFDSGCPGRTFAPAAFEGDRPMAQFAEKTLSTDGYDAELDVFGVYAMADTHVTPDLRLILGERFETTRQTIQSPDFGLGLPRSARLTSQDLLPSLSVVYSATKRAKVRGAVTRTLARPQARELAPFAFNEIYGGRSVSGNPDLKLTHITNVDMRFEFFPTLREVAAFSIFYKEFEDPIEPTLVAQSSGAILSYVNSPTAKLIGIELEARKNLGVLAPALDDFSLVSNLTLARSRISLEQSGYKTLTSTSRPLVNQAPWVFNLALDYDNEDIGTKLRASFNIAGRRLMEVGSGGVPDGYEQSSPSLDVAGTQELGHGFKVKAGVEDVLNSRTLITQGKSRRESIARESYRDGSVIFAGLAYDY